MIFLLAGFILIQFFMFLMFRSMLKIIGRRENMDFTKLNVALATLNTTVQGLPAAIAAEIASQNTASQAQIDAATTAVNNANTAIVAATTPAPAPAA